ncbi:hypothetical protein [Agromyces sp. ZXT2-6]|uniref:hypothetical protein n=1 Tax=Agromyces sp. ZXT2-6 TaxID=3461153 RepID=UPI0040552231
MAATFSLLPNARAPLLVDLRPPRPGGFRRRADVAVEIRTDGETVGNASLDVELRGAGDVVGVDPRMISRVEPTPAGRGFEPNYVPFVEFVDADFPWRYTLDTSGRDRVRPWLALIALRPAEFEFVELGGALLPVIRVLEPRTSLPDLSQSWAWAHVHVSREVAPDVAVDELVRTHADAVFARLLCARRLTDSSVYHLFLVPSYAAGRLAGLGLPVQPTPWNALAWGGSPDPVVLPVYFQSHFVTSAVEDLELLLRRLRPLPATDASGVAVTRLARADDPGFFPGFSAPGRTITVRHALARLGTELGPIETPPALRPLLAAALTGAIAAETPAPDGDGPDAEDPLLAPPAYGWRSTPTRDVRVGRAEANHWFDRINLDLGLREAAGLGAETVRRNQEALVRLCYSQHDEAVRANERINRFRLAAAMAQRLVASRFNRLPAEVALAAAEPLAPYQPVGEGRTMREALRAVGVPSTFASRDLRRQSAKRPTRGLVPTIRVPTLPSGRPPTQPNALPSPQVPAALAGFIRDELGAAEVFEPARQPGIAIPVGRATAVELVAPVRATLIRLPAAKAADVIAGLSARERNVLGPVVRHPTPPVAMSPLLEKFAPDRILSELTGLPENTVTLVEEHRPFIEAFLVGANHELANELRWRGFPMDGSRTVLTRFWDRGRAGSDPTGADIPPIHLWSRTPGLNLPPHDDGQADLVLVLRSDAIRRFGQLVAVLNRGPGTTWRQGEGTDHHPVFFGRLGADVAYYGFAIGRAAVEAALNRFFLVLFEPVGRLRFGLDIATVRVRRERQQYRAMALPFALATLGRVLDDTIPTEFAQVDPPEPTEIPSWDDLSWSHVNLTAAGYLDVASTALAVQNGPDYWGPGRTSATIARSMWQRPVAVVIPVRRLL